LATGIVVALATLAASPVRAGDTQVYKTTDAHGNVVYTDQAGAADSPQTTVRYHEPSADDLARLQKQRRAEEVTESQRLRDAANANVAQAQQQKAQQEQQARCENARRNYYAIKDATRLYDHNEQGDRVYLTDKEIDAKRAQALQSMTVACGS
jgi:hypothetical protein